MTTNTSDASRYSRQTAAYGERCGTRIFTSQCMVAFNPNTSAALAAELFKNLALSGVRELCLVDDGTPFDAAAHVSSNALVHPFILEQEKNASVAAASANPASLVDAFVTGLRELNSGLAVTVARFRQDSSNNSGSWFSCVHEVVRHKFDQVQRESGSSSSFLFILLHPHDRRENSDMAHLFRELENGGATAGAGAAAVPYMHVQTASLYGRITNWFGKRFKVLDATPAQTVQATVASIGVVVVPSNFSAAGNKMINDDDDDNDAQKSGANNNKRNNHQFSGPFVTLIDDDISADSLSGNPISVDNAIRLMYTGAKQQLQQQESAAASAASSVPSSNLLQQQLAEFDHRFGGFVVTAIEAIINQIDGKVTKRYFLSLNNNGSGSDITSDEQERQRRYPTSDAVTAFRQWAHAAAAARLPLRFAQQPPEAVITNFDTASTHTGDIGSDTALVLRALSRCEAEKKPVQSSDVADAAQAALVAVGSQREQPQNSAAKKSVDAAVPLLLRSITPDLSLRTRQAARTARIQPNFWATFLGAVAAQEALKFFTQRWVPASNPVCFDMAELFPKAKKPSSSAAVSSTDFFPADAISAAVDELNRPDVHYAALFGAAGLEQIRGGRVFLVGAGALGCEYLKTFALMGIGAGGKGVVTITDDDSIATSNLSRQLLFRERHVGENKSAVAAAAGKEMARLALKHRGGAVNFRALQKRLDDKSTHPITGVFNHRFWSQQTVLVSGVDNVKARSFLSEMSQQHLVPLVDGGTNGPLGHVACVLPFVVNPLQPPPPDTNRIAVCTLHFFPTTVAHCSQHALHTFRALFGEKEEDKDEQMNKKKQEQEQKDSSRADSSTVSAIVSSSSSSNNNNNTITVEDALREACNLWFPLFVQPVLDLRRSKPPDALDADGASPYYSPQSSRRCPSVPEFDPVNDEAHRAFICSCAKLLFRSIGKGVVDTEEEPGSPSTWNRAVANMALQNQWKEKMEDLVASYVPQLIQIPHDSSNNNKQAGGANTSVDKDAAAAQHEQEEERKAQAAAGATEAAEAENASVFARNRIVEMEFEKDDTDMLEFVWAATVVRARAYAIFSPSKSDVQRVAGRMIPALITTTAVVVAGGLFNIVALLQHHNPARPHRNPKAGSAAALFPLVSPDDLKRSSEAVWDYMVNLSDGGNAVFSFQQVLDLDAPLDVENTACDKWVRAMVSVPSDGSSDFTVFDLVVAIVRQHVAAGNHAVGEKKAASRAMRFRAEVSADLAAGAGVSSTRAAFDGAAVKQALEKCVVILKLRIGTGTETVFQHAPAAATAATITTGDSAAAAATAAIQVKDFPAALFLTAFLGEGTAPPFIESELLIHCGLSAGESSPATTDGAAKSGAKKDTSEGLTIYARLTLN